MTAIITLQYQHSCSTPNMGIVCLDSSIAQTTAFAIKPQLQLRVSTPNLQDYTLANDLENILLRAFHKDNVRLSRTSTFPMTTDSKFWQLDTSQCAQMLTSLMTVLEEQKNPAKTVLEQQKTPAKVDENSFKATLNNLTADNYIEESARADYLKKFTPFLAKSQK